MSKKGAQDWTEMAFFHKHVGNWYNAIKNSYDPKNEPQTPVLSFTSVLERFRLKSTKKNLISEKDSELAKNNSLFFHESNAVKNF